MKNLSSWLITIFLVMFWGSRVATAVSFQLGSEMILKPIDINAEIVLLFVVLICIPFVFKRKIIGPIVCLGVYGWYFGPTLVSNIILVFNNVPLELFTYVNMLAGAIGIVLPLISIFDILLEKTREKNPMDKKTDWYYKNEKYDRELDERADKNNYRTM